MCLPKERVVFQPSFWEAMLAFSSRGLSSKRKRHFSIGDNDFYKENLLLSIENRCQWQESIYCKHSSRGVKTLDRSWEFTGQRPTNSCHTYRQQRLFRDPNFFRSLRIMGSQNWWFPDPKPLLYTSKPLYSRIQWFLGQFVFPLTVGVTRELANVWNKAPTTVMLLKKQFLRASG